LICHAILNWNNVSILELAHDRPGVANNGGDDCEDIESFALRLAFLEFVVDESREHAHEVESEKSSH
jgi:hypothetical protein